MAKKSKTQRAKASAARAQRKAEREQAAKQEEAVVEEVPEEKPKRSLFKKNNDSSDKAIEKKDSGSKKAKESSKEISKSKKGKESNQSVSKAKKADKPKKVRFKFFKDVKAEMKRVTWPTRADVIRWSGVVLVALLFFGVFVAFLDNLVITPILVFISGIGA